MPDSPRCSPPITPTTAIGANCSPALTTSRKSPPPMCSAWPASIWFPKTERWRSPTAPPKERPVKSNRLLTGLLFAAVSLAVAQTPSKADHPRPVTATPSTKSATATPTVAPPASWKDLTFPKLPEIKIPKIDETTLPNGMKLYLLENHELPLVRGSALIRTGNLFDPADKVGLATITGETMRSGGTSKLTGDQIDVELENIAASVESEIGESSGSVAFSTLKERTDEVLGIFHDVLTDPAFRENKIDLWKAQENSAIERRNDEPMGITS